MIPPAPCQYGRAADTAGELRCARIGNLCDTATYIKVFFFQVAYLLTYSWFKVAPNKSYAANIITARPSSAALHPLDFSGMFCRQHTAALPPSSRSKTHITATLMLGLIFIGWEHATAFRHWE